MEKTNIHFGGPSKLPPDRPNRDDECAIECSGVAPTAPQGSPPNQHLLSFPQNSAPALDIYNEPEYDIDKRFKKLAQFILYDR